MVGSKSGGSRKQEFLRKGLDVLADEGSKSLSAARMARALEVSTGSFYWHFVSVSEFHDALRSYWKDIVIVGLVEEAKEKAKDEPARALEELADLIQTQKTYRYDSAMRDWAKTNDDAARIVEAADEWRRGVVTDFLHVTGAKESLSRDRANLLGAAWRGSDGMSDPAYRFKLMGLVTSKD
jgi:AcrR family transcriptional regulator